VRQSAAGKNVSMEAEDIVGIRHQATTSEDSRLGRPSTCCSELQSVRFNDSATVTCSYCSYDL
jgi:hypothetical protein